MSPELASAARLRAVEVSGDPRAVEGPLHGYHHETYVFPLPGETASPDPVRWKCREPRDNLLWFDRRCFVSEEQLLKALAGRISRIPDVFDVGTAGLQRFIEGRTLGSLYPFGGAVPEGIFDQIVVLFEQLARVTQETLTIDRRCADEDRPDDGDTNGFLRRLVHFTEKRVYEENLPKFERLFEDLGVDGRSFKWLRNHVAGLSQRPFCLLHADLHRENFVIDSRSRLWTIDWELAMVGDPLYDLATHLYLMRYPAWQEHRMVKRWRAAVDGIRPGSSKGLKRDLSLLIDYKKAQSVFTDVIREALSLDFGPDVEGRLDHAGRRLRTILVAAAVPLGLDMVPSRGEIVTALVRWRQQHGNAEVPGSQ
ncbi:aminoglycoside phosphotransferase [Streptomyces sp. SA15]|uniref:aminoglycoside phosphotransferase family protein n=1 Tax=Streptomyces sp. SA15 TaxID=934019 RepID=UPI000BAFD3E8|nr:aminoglycoside phosphotransferase family protein [Streptomyces sp. SA15]PAZ13254.1 aminoglycoside phosphotransferase [Streptomyces sp. SA15]